MVRAKRDATTTKEQPRCSVLVYALLLGATGGASRSVGSTLMPRWFGMDHIGSITGLATLVSAAGTAVGPVAYSLARDMTGTYTTVSLLFVAVPLLVALAAIAAGQRIMASTDGFP